MHLHKLNNTLAYNMSAPKVFSKASPEQPCWSGYYVTFGLDENSREGKILKEQEAKVNKAKGDRNISNQKSILKSYEKLLVPGMHRKPGHLGRQRVIRLGNPKYTSEEDRKNSQMHRENMKNVKDDNEEMEIIDMDECKDEPPYDPFGFIRSFFKTNTNGQMGRHMFA